MPARLLVGVAVAIAALACLGASPIAEAEPASAIFTGFRASSKDPINVDAKSLEISEVDKQRVSVFSGGVTIRRGDTILRAGTVKLFEDLGESGPKKNPFSRIEAAGKVSVSSGTQTVTGDNAVFNTSANTIVLAGNVVLRQGSNRITGDRLAINLTTGVARIEQTTGGGQIKGVFTPGSPLLRAEPGG